MKSLFFAITLSISVSILALNCDHQGQWDFCNLGLSPESQIVWSSDANFKNATTQRYTDYKPPTYQASIIPASETDVQKIVTFASAKNISFLATGGGHGFSTTFGELRNGLEIDLRNFKQISINKDASTMIVGGGVQIGEVIGPLFNAGKEMQTGSEKCVGLIGSTLGGGIGRLNGLHGLVIDALLSVRIVVASGEVIVASNTENRELFWAIRGAGFNYGIIVSATYQVYDSSNGGEVMNADFLFPTNDTTAIFEYFKSLETEIPAELSLIFHAGYRPDLGGTYVVVNAVYFGALDNGIPLLEPLLTLHPTMHNVTMVPYRDLLSSAFFGATPPSTPCPRDSLRNVYGLGVKTYDVPTLQSFFDRLTDLYETYPDVRGSVFFIEAFPMQAARAVPDEETAYPHRDINGHLLFNYGYTDRSLDEMVNEFAVNMRTQFVETGGFDDIKTYVSYGHGDETAAQLYGNRKLPQLRELKMEWDPKGLFNFNQPF